MRIHREHPTLLDALKAHLDHRGCVVRPINPDGRGNSFKEMYAYRELRRIATNKKLLPIPSLYVVEGNADINAYSVKSDGGRHAVCAIAMTKELIDNASKPEITASIEHELAHLSLDHAGGLLKRTLRTKRELEADDEVSNPAQFVKLLRKSDAAYLERIYSVMNKEAIPEEERDALAKEVVRATLEAEHRMHPTDYVRYNRLLRRRKDGQDRGRQA